MLVFEKIICVMMKKRTGEEYETEKKLCGN